MQKISGNEISKKILARMERIPAPKGEFTAILVGENAFSLNFLKEKGKVAESLGIKFKLHRIPAKTSETNLKEIILDLADNKKIGGIIIQLPLPKNFNRHAVLNAVPPEKDVDVLGEWAIGAFYNGHNYIIPPSVATVEEILKSCKVDLSKMNVAVVGLGLLIGRPIATWLMNRCRNLSLIGRSANLTQVKRADIIISGVGQAGLIKPEMLKSGAIVIDFGYDYSEGRLQGDLDVLKPAKLKKLKYYTPTPGGTGPILIAKLFENFYRLNGYN